MRILQLCKKTPIPTKDGEALAILNFTKLLIKQNAEVTILAIATPKHNSVSVEFPESLKHKIKYRKCFVNTNFKALGFLSAFIKRRSYALQRFYSKQFEALIVNELKTAEYDIVQLEGLYLVPYIKSIKKFSKAKIVLRAHNVEHQLWYKLAENTNNYFKKILFKRNAEELRKAEKNNYPNLDAIVSISTTDEAHFKQNQKTPVYNLPFGIDIHNYKIENQTFKKSIAFIGSLDWLPNLEGLHWFLNKVYPLVLKEIPGIKFYVAGRNLKDVGQFKKYPSTYITGEVEYAKAFIAEHPVFVVPLLSGSGMRIKIIEAMALKRAVVSTTLGAAGIDYTDKENILIEDSATNLANAIIYLLQNRQSITSLGENARKLISKRYNNDILGDQLTSFYDSLLL